MAQLRKPDVFGRPEVPGHLHIEVDPIEVPCNCIVPCGYKHYRMGPRRVVAAPPKPKDQEEE